MRHILSILAKNSVAFTQDQKFSKRWSLILAVLSKFFISTTNFIN